MNRVLVTGAEGFIGRALCRALKSNGCQVRELTRRQGDISDAPVLDNVEDVEHVFHLAARTFVPDSWNDPLGFHRTNVLGTVNVLDYCRQHNARMTFMSAYLYGTPSTLPVSENCTPHPNNPYAMSKYLAEQTCQFYAEHYGVKVVVVRPFNIYGPGQKSDFLVPGILDQIRRGTTIRVKDLKPRRDFIYIDDLVAALVRTMHQSGGFDAINIGSGRSISVRDVISIAQAAAGTALPVREEGEVRVNEIPDVYADISKAWTTLQWKPTINFAQGIEQMLQQEVAP